MSEKETGVFDTFSKGINNINKTISGITNLALDDEARNLALKTRDVIEEAEKSTDPNIKKTLELLKATGSIEMGIFNRARVIARFSDGSGKSGAQAILHAFEEAKKGIISIVLFSKGKYSPMSMGEYEKLVSSDPNQMNTSVSGGLWGLYKQGSSLGFQKETWSNISVYCAKKNWKTNIIGDNIAMQENIKELYLERKIKEEKKLDTIILESILPNISKDDPRFSELLSKVNLEKNPNGTINATKAIEKMNIVNINQVPEEFQKIAETMKKESKELFKIAKEITKTISIKGLSDLKIEGLGERGILNKPFDTFTEDEIKKYLPLLQDHLKEIKDPKQIENIQNINKILISRMKGFEKARNAADSQNKARSAKKEILKNPNITPEELGNTLNSKIEQEKSILAQEVVVSRISSDDHLNILQSHGINNLEMAQEKLEELEKKGKTTKEDDILRSVLVGYIQSKIHEAQVYKNYGNNLTEVDKKDIFTESNRFITDNPKETYDFKALEKIAILTDPESTPGERAFARLEPGQSISIGNFMEGEVMQNSLASAPEIANMNISMNQDGTFDIPLFRENNLTEPQVKEYMTSISLYADLGLSQFIPHIPIITEELRSKGVNTKVDGSTGTMEQQQVLKYLYTQLFTEKLETDSLPEVQSAFHSQMNLAPNMKIAMQETLEDNGLINSPGQPIAADTIKTWLRGTPSGSHLHIDPLANMV